VAVARCDYALNPIVRYARRNRDLLTSHSECGCGSGPTSLYVAQYQSCSISHARQIQYLLCRTDAAFQYMHPLFSICAEKLPVRNRPELPNFGHETLGPLRCRPNVQLMPPSRMIPDTFLPICRSITGRHGTKVKSRDRSTRACRPLVISMARINRPRIGSCGRASAKGLLISPDSWSATRSNSRRCREASRLR